MAEIVFERFTYCPTGNSKDEKVFEVVIEDNSELSAHDATERTTIISRIFTRGDIEALRGSTRELILTDKSQKRTILRSVKTTTEHISVDVSQENYRLEWTTEEKTGRHRLNLLDCDVRAEKALSGKTATAGQELGTYLTQKHG